MDTHLLDSVSGDAIARDWELPELPSGTTSLRTTPSLPTSQELAEIFGNSDDEDDDFPFPVSTDLQVGPTLSGSGESLDGKQLSNSSLFSSAVMRTDATGLFLGQLGDSLVPPQPPVTNVGGASEPNAEEAAGPIRKSARLSSKQPKVITEDVKNTKPPQKAPEKPKNESDEGRDAQDAQKSTDKSSVVAVNHKKGQAEVESTASKEESGSEGGTEEAQGGQEEGSGDGGSEEEGFISDDPDRLWCVCKKPHNDRFMICCDLCEEWFHGDCVGISVSQGKRMERAGQDYICPNCTKKSKFEKEERSANRMARQAKREELRDEKSKIIAEKHKDMSSHRKKSSKEGSVDDYGMNLLFQPDNAPHRQSTASNPHQEGGGERKGSFYKEESSPTTCLASQCSAQTTPPSLYCSDTCIEKYAMDALKNLASRGVTFETNPSEFVRGSKGVSMIDKVAGKTVIGIQAPTDKTLVSWLKQHQSYKVMLPAKMRGRGLSSRSSRLRRTRGSEEGLGSGRKEGEERREGESPSKQRSLNDPETVRINAKKALLQTLWKRKEAVDDVMVTQDQVESIANQIEEELYDLHGDINTKYKTKYRSLLFNLKDTKNQGLFRKVCLGKISPTELVRMRSEQYASDELAEWREKTLKKDLDKIVEGEEKARSSKQVIRKITYKGEFEIEAERTEAIETIAPPEEPDLTPSTPLTPTATKFPVQSQDGAKATVKQDAPNGVKTKPSKQDSLKTKHVKEKPPATKSEPATTTEAKEATSEAGKEDEGKRQSAGGLLDLLTDTTSEHGKHIYHPHCQICLGKKEAPVSTEDHKNDEQLSSTAAEDMQMERNYLSSLPPAIPLLWEGIIDMPGTVSFASSAYPVSGNTAYVTTVLPPTLHVMGRIVQGQVWDYINKLRTSTTREIVVLRFDWTEEDRDGYESILNYLVRKRRFGVVDEQLHGIKDFYLVPLMVDQDIPAHLLPFSGPGLPEDRPNLLLGVIVQTRGITPASPSAQESSLSLAPPTTTHSAVNSLKRHLSASSDDHMSETTSAKRKRREHVVGFGGQTPPPVGNNEEDTEPMDVGEPKNLSGDRKTVQMSFYGRHRSLSESTTTGSSPKSAGISAPSTSGMKSILSQLSDEKLKELASAMSSLEESTVSSPPVTSEVTSSTVTSPATGQTVTTSSVSAQQSASTGPLSKQHAAPHVGASVKTDVLSQSAPSAGGHDHRYQHHHPPNLSQLQRPPLHDTNTHRAVTGPSQPPPNAQYHNYASPQANEQGPPPANWNSPNQPYHSGGPPQNSAPPPQITDHQYTGSPQQYSGPPNQFSAPPHPQQYSGPPHQYSAPHTQPTGPPNQPMHGQPYSNPPHQYPQEHPGGPQQHGPSYSYDPQPPHYQNQYKQQHSGFSDPRGAGWSHEGPPHPPHPPSRHGPHYYENDSRLDDLESRDYGHRSQPPGHSWRARDGGHNSGGRPGGWKGRHDYHGRDRR